MPRTESDPGPLLDIALGRGVENEFPPRDVVLTLNGVHVHGVQGLRLEDELGGQRALSVTLGRPDSILDNIDPAGRYELVVKVMSSDGKAVLSSWFLLGARLEVARVGRPLRFVGTPTTAA